MGQVGGFAFAAFQNGVGMGRIAQVLVSEPFKTVAWADGSPTYPRQIAKFFGASDR
jgi:hypothetical protein